MAEKIISWEVVIEEPPLDWTGKPDVLQESAEVDSAPGGQKMEELEAYRRWAVREAQKEAKR